MFGYVRPFRDELKCRDFDLYRATYCGLCRAMRRRYGWLAPMFLNYDFTFLALLLSPSEERFTLCRGRCHANPLRKKTMCPPSEALDTAADESVILTWWQLQDRAADSKGGRKLVSWGLGKLLKPAYRKAACRRPAFDQAVRESLSRLAGLEREKCASMDRAADTFARLLQAAAPEAGGQSRVLSQLLYHLGRWIYLADARDDLEEDRQAARYNPVAARFGPQGDDEALGQTMQRSLELAGAAFQLGEFGCRTPILENILYLGLPLVQRAVFDGSWAQIKKQKIWRSDR